jgi:hypothetical protein
MYLLRIKFIEEQEGTSATVLPGYVDCLWAEARIRAPFNDMQV